MEQRQEMQEQQNLTSKHAEDWWAMYEGNRNDLPGIDVGMNMMELRNHSSNHLNMEKRACNLVLACCYIAPQ